MKTIRVRIAVAVNEDGEWSAFGSSPADDDDRQEALYNVRDDMPRAVVWVEADVPVPESQTIEGKVMP